MTYISDINPASPSGDDLLLNGDDQIRALKADLKNTLGGLNGPVREDADTSGVGGSTLVTAATMSSWEARIKALEAGGGGGTAPATGSIPVGGIMVWYGDVNTIPTGWKQCNGASYTYTPVGGGSATIQTPDLRGRAIFGPGATNSPGWNVGSTPNWALLFGTIPYIPATTGDSPAHTHTTSTPGTALSVAQLPNHTHAMFSDENISISGSDPAKVGFLQYASNELTNPSGSQAYSIAASSGGGATAPTAGIVGATGSGSTHTHPNATSGASGVHSHGVGVNPPYLGLYHIMYVADGVPA
jgi:microcystin-dependent protein